MSEVRSLKLDCGQSEQQISVFPNPSKGSINLVYLSEEAGQILELDVVDMTGRKIMSKGIELQAGNNVLNLDLSSVAIGQYFLRYAVQEAGVKGAVKFLKD
ncbi:MAG: T9SS type A sorting domain-containing protein [Bacteroidetes bacterium]|nr:T9SS type A sorting domain-containing protein [Bacteroidota bacterium]